MLARDLLLQKDPILEYRYFLASKTIQRDSVLLSRLEAFPFDDYMEYENTIDQIYQAYFSTLSSGADVW